MNFCDAQYFVKERKKHTRYAKVLQNSSESEEIIAFAVSQLFKIGKINVVKPLIKNE